MHRDTLEINDRSDSLKIGEFQLNTCRLTVIDLVISDKKQKNSRT